MSLTHLNIAPYKRTLNTSLVNKRGNKFMNGNQNTLLLWWRNALRATDFRSPRMVTVIVCLIVVCFTSLAHRNEMLARIKLVE